VNLTGHKPGQESCAKGPVFITDRGRPAHVVLTIEDYQRLAGPTGRRISISSRRALEAFSRRLISTDVPDRRARIQIGARIDSIIPPIASQASVGPD
jgi:hypothetical protein